jgi:WD40-like Beta Propeller Repeat
MNEMRKLQLTLIFVLLFAPACGPQVGVPTTTIQRTSQPEVAGTATSEDRPTPSQPSPSITTTATSASACPSLATIEAPGASRFNPIEDTGAIAYSGDGLELVFPNTSSTVVIHPLTKLGLDGVDRNFVWSPDGTQIAFLHTDPGSEDCARGYLMLADLSLGEVRLLIKTPGLYSQPAWSPDSKWLAFTQEIGQLNVVNGSNGELLMLSDDAHGLVPPAWLDAKHVVYVRSTGFKDLADLVSQALDGSTPNVLLKGVSLYGFALSPNSRQLAYYGGSLTLLDLQSGATHDLGLEPSERLQWSPNGQYLLGRGGLAGIYLIRPNASSQVTQVNFLGLPGPAQSWASDSQHFVALIGPEDALPLIGIYNVDTQTLRELPVTVHPPYVLAWSPR